MSTRRKPTTPANDAAAQPAAEPPVPELAPEVIASSEPPFVVEQPRPTCGGNCEHHHDVRRFHALCEFFGRAPANLEIAKADPRIAELEQKLAAAIARNDYARNVYSLRVALLHAKAEAAFPIGAEHFSEQHCRDLACNGVHLHPHKPAA